MDPKVSSLRKTTFQYIAPRLFNHLPKDIRNHNGSMDSFKIQLDEFLALIPDEPRLKKGSRMYSNTLENQLTNWTWTLKNNCIIFSGVIKNPFLVSLRLSVEVEHYCPGRVFL